MGKALTYVLSKGALASAPFLRLLRKVGGRLQYSFENFLNLNDSRLEGAPPEKPYIHQPVKHLPNVDIKSKKPSMILVTAAFAPDQAQLAASRQAEALRTVKPATALTSIGNRRSNMHARRQYGIRSHS